MRRASTQQQPAVDGPSSVSSEFLFVFGVSESAALNSTADSVAQRDYLVII
jgi:hypothetical protein